MEKLSTVVVHLIIIRNEQINPIYLEAIASPEQRAGDTRGLQFFDASWLNPVMVYPGGT